MNTHTNHTYIIEHLTHMSLQEHEQIVNQLQESLLVRKMQYLMQIVSDRSAAFVDRLIELDKLLSIMLEQTQFLAKYEHFVDVTPEKMIQIRDELRTHCAKDPERVQRLCERLQEVAETYAKKKNGKKNDS